MRLSSKKGAIYKIGHEIKISILPPGPVRVTLFKAWTSLEMGLVKVSHDKQASGTEEHFILSGSIAVCYSQIKLIPKSANLISFTNFWLVTNAENTA